jgi:hypothetical protein
MKENKMKIRTIRADLVTRELEGIYGEKIGEREH